MGGGFQVVASEQVLVKRDLADGGDAGDQVKSGGALVGVVANGRSR